jgi:hypothetical protein
VRGEAHRTAQRQQPGQTAPAAAPQAPAEVSAAERAQVTQLIANGKSTVAVDIAKQIHKRCGNATSEALLVDAYAARIRSLAERNLTAEARALSDLVQERYPSSRDRLCFVAASIGVRDGALTALLAPLMDPSLPPEGRAEIDAYIQREVTDLRALADCESLAADHPLRTAAATLAAAFDAVTSGPVDEEALALPDIPRRSPLAPWKLLIRAIGAFYRRDDEACRKSLHAIGPGVAAARLVSALRALLGEKMPLQPAAAALVAQVTGGVEVLRETLRKLDRALDNRDQPRILALIRDAVSACRQGRPELLERLRQHISVRSMLAGLRADVVTAAMQGPSLKNAYFWRLLARAAEDSRSDAIAIPHACSLWEEFRKHALREGWFPAKGPEVATLYLHMADLLQRLAAEELGHCQLAFARQFNGHRDYYQSQPPEIRALAPKPGLPDLYFVDPFALLERASTADPRRENFQRWLDWAKRHRRASAESVAWKYRVAHPNDASPLLYLMESSESRNALQRAFKYMQMAENLDGLNPEVRRARLRLLISMAIRHLKQKKTHLAERELLGLEALPQAQQGDRPAFVAALRWLSFLISGATKEASEAAVTVCQVLGGDVAARVVLTGVARATKYRAAIMVPAIPVRDAPLAAGIGRACALGEDVGMPFEIPPELRSQLMRELSRSVSGVPSAALLALGEAALRAEDFRLAYAISAACFSQDSTAPAAALYLRARALPPWEDDRSEACLGAAAEIARRQRNLALLHKMGAWREEAEWLDLRESSGIFMSPDRVRFIVEQEARLREFPEAPSGDFALEQCDCPICRGQRSPEMGSFEQALAELVEQVGPEAAAGALAEILGLPDTAGGNRRRSRKGSFPF